jgi:prepilin-type N-terminal cleavage/methylation domain-containing protein
MGSLKTDKGMTLVEVVISLAILGIITVVFLGMFTSGFGGIISAGKYSQAEYEAQEAMEHRIGGVTVAATPSLTPTTISGKTVSISFPGVPISATGKLEKIVYNDGKHSVELSTFIPNP